MNSDTAPDGTQTAATWVATASSTPNYATAVVPNPSLYDGETVTASVYMRSPSGPVTANLLLVENGDQGWTNR